MLLKATIVLFIASVCSQGVQEKGNLDDLIKGVFDDPNNPNSGRADPVVNEKVRELIKNVFEA